MMPAICSLMTFSLRTESLDGEQKHRWISRLNELIPQTSLASPRCGREQPPLVQSQPDRQGVIDFRGGQSITPKEIASYLPEEQPPYYED